MKILLQLIVCTLSWSTCFSCSCAPRHLQSRYCNSDYALKIMVKSKTIPSPVKIHHGNREYLRMPLDAMLLYTVQVIETYKVPPSSDVGNGDIIHALSSYVNSCGERLIMDREYLLTGSRSEKGLVFGSCDFPALFTDVTPQQLNGLLGGYQCDCKIESGREFSNSVCSLPTSNKCRWDYLRYGACKEVKDTCVWAIDDEHKC